MTVAIGAAVGASVGTVVAPAMLTGMLWGAAQAYLVSQVKQKGFELISHFFQSVEYSLPKHTAIHYTLNMTETAVQGVLVGYFLVENTLYGVVAATAGIVTGKISVQISDAAMTKLGLSKDSTIRTVANCFTGLAGGCFGTVAAKKGLDFFYPKDATDTPSVKPSTSSGSSNSSFNSTQGEWHGGDTFYDAPEHQGWMNTSTKSNSRLPFGHQHSKPDLEGIKRAARQALPPINPECDCAYDEPSINISSNHNLFTGNEHECNDVLISGRFTTVTYRGYSARCARILTRDDPLVWFHDESGEKVRLIARQSDDFIFTSGSSAYDGYFEIKFNSELHTSDSSCNRCYVNVNERGLAWLSDTSMNNSFIELINGTVEVYGSAGLNAKLVLRGGTLKILSQSALQNGTVILCPNGNIEGSNPNYQLMNITNESDCPPPYAPPSKQPSPSTSDINITPSTTLSDSASSTFEFTLETSSKSESITITMDHKTQFVTKTSTSSYSNNPSQTPSTTIFMEPSTKPDPTNSSQVAPYVVPVSIIGATAGIAVVIIFGGFVLYCVIDKCPKTKNYTLRVVKAVRRIGYDDTTMLQGDGDTESIELNQLRDSDGRFHISINPRVTVSPTITINPSFNNYGTGNLPFPEDKRTDYPGHRAHPKAISDSTNSEHYDT
ncbi:hypothetical protein [Parashewanella curva]|nr:hypothetical protein [Parashewanella curva]